nr:extracellular solute-binding protein [Halorubrum saccharovorum]
MRDETDATVAEITEMRERVGEGIDTAESALEAFTDLTDDIEETTSGVEEISAASDDQAAAIEEAVDMVESVGGLADDTAEDAAEVTTIAHTQKTSLTEVAAGASTLNDRTGALDDRLDAYDLVGGAADDDDTVVEFWHALGGRKARLLDEFVDEFEAATEGVSVRPSSKGSYRGVFDATLAAAERGDPPAIAHLYEIGTKRALDSGAFAPVEDLLAETQLSPDDLLDPVANYYRTDGRLHSLPFNASTPVLYYDRAAFERAGLNPDDPPATFAEVRHCAERLVERGGVETGITFANYSWFVEQWFAEAGQPLVDAENGRAGTPTEAYFDAEAGERVYEWIADMAADDLYHDPGIEARGQAREAFHAGRAGILIGSTSAMADVHENASFPVGTGYFPVADERHGVVVGGGSLWVADRATAEQQRAAAAFLGWLAAPEQQARWHRETGYFPVHEGAVDRLTRDGWFDENPGYRTAMDQLLDAEESVATTGARMGPFDTVRTLVAEASVDAREYGVAEALDRLTESAELQLQSYAQGTDDR